MKRLLLLIAFIFIVFEITFAQDFEKTKQKLESPEHGKYQPNQSIKEFPYTTFYKPLNGYYIEEIRQKVIDGKYDKYFYYIFSSIYTDAQRTYSSNDLTGKNDDAAAKNAYYAKHAAFVYLMGFDKDGGYLRGSGDAGKIAELYTFRTTALKRLKNLDYEVSAGDNIQYRVKEMVHYLQAYDYLKAAGVVPNYDLTKRLRCSLEGMYSRFIYRNDRVQFTTYNFDVVLLKI